MTYAIVKTGGKQYRVEQGQTLLVEKLAADEGATVGLEPLLYRGDDAPATPRRRTRRKPAPADPEAEALEQQADDAEDVVGADAPEGSGEGDAVESKPRRRGRRGGRRRSAAKAEATPAD